MVDEKLNTINSETLQTIRNLIFPLQNRIYQTFINLTYFYNNNNSIEEFQNRSADFLFIIQQILNNPYQSSREDVICSYIVKKYLDNNDIVNGKALTNIINENYFYN